MVKRDAAKGIELYRQLAYAIQHWPTKKTSQTKDVSRMPKTNSNLATRSANNTLIGETKRQ